MAFILETTDLICRNYLALFSENCGLHFGYNWPSRNGITIDKKQYKELIHFNEADAYLKCHNKQEQNQLVDLDKRVVVINDRYSLLRPERIRQEKLVYTHKMEIRRPARFRRMIDPVGLLRD